MSYYVLESSDLTKAREGLIGVLQRNRTRTEKGRISHERLRWNVCQIFFEDREKYKEFWAAYIPEPQDQKTQRVHLFVYGTPEDIDLQHNICQTKICSEYQKKAVGGVFARGDDGQVHLFHRGRFNGYDFEGFRRYWKQVYTIFDGDEDHDVFYIGPLTDDLIPALSKFVYAVYDMKK